MAAAGYFISFRIRAADRFASNRCPVVARTGVASTPGVATVARGRRRLRANAVRRCEARATVPTTARRRTELRRQRRDQRRRLTPSTLCRATAAPYRPRTRRRRRLRPDVVLRRGCTRTGVADCASTPGGSGSTRTGVRRLLAYARRGRPRSPPRTRRRRQLRGDAVLRRSCECTSTVNRVLTLCCGARLRRRQRREAPALASSTDRRHWAARRLRSSRPRTHHHRRLRPDVAMRRSCTRTDVVECVWTPGGGTGSARTVVRRLLIGTHRGRSRRSLPQRLPASQPLHSVVVGHVPTPVDVAPRAHGCHWPRLDAPAWQPLLTVVAGHVPTPCDVSRRCSSRRRHAVRPSRTAIADYVPTPGAVAPHAHQRRRLQIDAPRCCSGAGTDVVDRPSTLDRATAAGRLDRARTVVVGSAQTSCCDAAAARAPSSPTARRRTPCEATVAHGRRRQRADAV